MRRLTCALAIPLALAACADQTAAPTDLSTATDLAATTDMSISDISIADISMNDRSIPDSSIPDQSIPDISTVDIQSVDQSTASSPDSSPPSDLSTPPDLSAPPDLTPAPVLSTVSAQQQPNHRAVTVTWSANGYTGPATCQVSLGGTDVGAPVACSAEQAAVDLPWLDGQTAWNVALTVAVTPSFGSGASAPFTPACTPGAGSATSTPDVDEDCDGHWDNTVTSLGFQTPPLEITYCNGTSTFITFDLGTQPDPATCLAQCTSRINQPWDMSVFFCTNCYWDGPDSRCWVGGTSICTSSTEQSYKWNSITVTTYY